MTEPSDEDLLQRVARGDQAAFEPLLTRHQEFAWRVAWRLLSRSHDAEEVVQEAFLLIFETADRYKPEAPFRVFLHRILTNRCLDRLRKKKPGTLDVLTWEGLSTLPSPEENLAQKEKNRLLQEALQRLPEHQQVAVTLFYYGQMSQREIAQVLEKSEKSVERLLARARETLAEDLSAQI